MPVAIDVIADTERAQALLSAVRIELLRRLAEPASAATLGRAMELPRQRLNYHLRELEKHGLIELVEERQRGNATERIYRRTGLAYAVSTRALGPLGAAPGDVQDRFSSAYQIALASRAIDELAQLQAGADAERKRLPTLALDVDVRFASAAARNAFGEELAGAVAELVRKYHDQRAPQGRWVRVYAGVYPRPKGRDG
ncbi:MAG: helix-turn-helix transcriptional regulator [Planctomycetes bacterium]|nr:helix-turn-helix transcriptional regulator [Planctomycetota bacterium]